MSHDISTAILNDIARSAEMQYQYSDVIVSVMASQNTGVSIIYSIVCSGADQR